MEPETCTAAKGKDADEDQNVTYPSTGDKADQDQQILIEEGDTYWYKSTLALKHLQAAFVPVVETEIKSLQEKSQTDFGRQLCKEATAEDIIRTSPNMAQFRHDCPGTLVFCQSLLNIIKGHTTDSVNFFEMLQGTDPQNWLKSPFEFVRLFLKDKMKFKVKDFQDCDITALCSIIKRCKPLMQMFGSKIDAVRDARNTTFHCSIMNISKQEMEDIVDVILDFLQQIKSLKNTDEVTVAIERIKQVKSGDIRLSQCKDAIQGWLPSARRKLEHTLDVANNLHENITYVENEWTRLSPEVAASKSKGEETKFEEKTLTEKQPDETRMWKQRYENLVKLLQDEKERRRELEKQIEELRKPLSSSDTATASTSFEGKHTPEVSSMTSSADSSDNRDSSSGPSQTFKDQPEKSIIHVQDETVPLTGTPSESHPPQLSDRDTLASVACKYEPANEGEISHFNIQCQTPAWRKPSKKVQVGPSQGCDAWTQTEWEVCISPALIESVHESEEDDYIDSVLDMSDWESCSGDEDKERW